MFRQETEELVEVILDYWGKLHHRLFLEKNRSSWRIQAAGGAATGGFQRGRSDLALNIRLMIS